MKSKLTKAEKENLQQAVEELKSWQNVPIAARLADAVASKLLSPDEIRDALEQAELIVDALSNLDFTLPYLPTKARGKRIATAA